MAAPALPPMITALLDREAHPDDPAEISLAQTHISYLLFTPAHVYKIKKPVDFGFLDFTTLEKRRHFCEEEVRLNRRLTRDVYLSVVEIKEQGGNFSIEGAGETVEYAVKMRRIKEEYVLNTMVASGKAGVDTLRKVAARIAAFHKEAERSERIDEFGAYEAIEKNIVENLTQSEPFAGVTITKERLEDIKSFMRGYLDKNKKLFGERVKGGWIRDCHGDLHSDHISIDIDTGEINIIDCIEFNDRFRYCDTARDSAFLLMDLEYLGRGDLALAFKNEYFSLTSDSVGPTMMDFYKCYLAVVRAKVDSFQLAEGEISPEGKERAGARAARYFHLAWQYSQKGYRPLLVVICGLSGTGKSTVAERLARDTCMVRISSDVTRKELAGLPPLARRPAEFNADIYTKEMTERTYEKIFAHAKGLLKSGRSVVLDATFSKATQIEGARKAAKESGAEIRVVECVASDETVRKRMEKRSKEPSVSDADFEIYLKQKKAREEIADAKITLSTEEAPEAVALRLIKKIFD